MAQQSDEIVWNVLGSNFCSYKMKTRESFTFCRNPYNVTGQCDRKSCPLANSKYATVREIEGKLILFTRNRNKNLQHCPSKMWESVELPNDDFEECCKVIEKKLKKYSNFLSEKCKIRAGKYVESRMRREAIKNNPLTKILKPRLTKVIRRERDREKRALRNALLDQQIEKELVNRLKVGVYGDIYNLDEKKFNKILDKQQRIKEKIEYEYEDEEEEDQIEEFEFESEYEDEEEVNKEYIFEEEEEDVESIELEEETKRKQKDYKKIMKNQDQSTRKSAISSSADINAKERNAKRSKLEIKEQFEYSENDIEDIIPPSSLALFSKSKKGKVEIEYETEIPERLLVRNK